MVRDEFEFRKMNQLRKNDKSSEQRWDDKIKELCEKINKTKDYYTTSSCAGRVVLVKGIPKKAEDIFLFKSHNKVSFSEIKKALEEINYKKLIYFKQEPFILHVACRTLEDAENLLDKARDAGIKKKGIITTRSRVIVELNGTEKLELPITEELTDNYLKFLLKEANSRLERTWEKLAKLERRFRKV
jgi:tRNA wybutosine-synthesizing protein 3